jgi:hypothetical protein
MYLSVCFWCHSFLKFCWEKFCKFCDFAKVNYVSCLKRHFLLVFLYIILLTEYKLSKYNYNKTCFKHVSRLFLTKLFTVGASSRNLKLGPYLLQQKYKKWNTYCTNTWLAGWAAWDAGWDAPWKLSISASKLKRHGSVGLSPLTKILVSHVLIFNTDSQHPSQYLTIIIVTSLLKGRMDV